MFLPQQKEETFNILIQITLFTITLLFFYILNIAVL